MTEHRFRVTVEQASTWLHFGPAGVDSAPALCIVVATGGAATEWTPMTAFATSDAKAVASSLFDEDSIYERTHVALFVVYMPMAEAEYLEWVSRAWRDRLAT